MMFSDAEVLLVMQNSEDRAFAAGQINVANREIRRLRAELAAVTAELKTEKARRHAAEFAARRH
jgi:hypothetical protein